MGKKIKCITIFGTRPEAIKLAPLVKLLEKDEFFDSMVCVTAQHREMLDQVLNLFEIKPDHDLNLMTKNQGLSDLTSKIISGITEVLNIEKPDIIFVQGDTTTTFASALSAFYLKIPIGHIEAGLRTMNKFSPFPEEINRRLTTHLADFHFAPTKTSGDNLLREGVKESSVFITGNTVIDALFYLVEKLKQPEYTERLKSYFLNNHGLDLNSSKKKILVTGHRRENFGLPFENICNALKEIAKKNQDVDIIYPVHLNPNVQKTVYEMLKDTANIKLIAPLDYEPFVFLMNESHLILTDSGGVQEEAPSLGKPVVVMRDTTERPEGVEAGTAILVGTDKQKIIDITDRLLNDISFYNSMANAVNPYGDGSTSEKIIGIIKNSGSF